MFFNPLLSNFIAGISHCFLYSGESVNIYALRSTIARPFASAAIGRIIAKDHLQSRSKWQFLHDLAEAPAGDFGDAITIARQPAGAV